MEVNIFYSSVFLFEIEARFPRRGNSVDRFLKNRNKNNESTENETETHTHTQITSFLVIRHLNSPQNRVSGPMDTTGASMPPSSDVQIRHQTVPNRRPKRRSETKLKTRFYPPPLPLHLRTIGAAMNPKANGNEERSMISDQLQRWKLQKERKILKKGSIRVKPRNNGQKLNRRSCENEMPAKVKRSKSKKEPRPPFLVENREPTQIESSHSSQNPVTLGECRIVRLEEIFSSPCLSAKKKIKSSSNSLKKRDVEWNTAGHWRPLNKNIKVQVRPREKREKEPFRGVASRIEPILDCLHWGKKKEEIFIFQSLANNRIRF